LALGQALGGAGKFGDLKRRLLFLVGAWVWTVLETVLVMLHNE